MAIEDVNKFDYQFLKGEWEGPGGAALNLTYEYCRNSGWGGYGAPTERGQKAIEYYERYKKHDDEQSAVP